MQNNGTLGGAFLVTRSCLSLEAIVQHSNDRLAEPAVCYLHAIIAV
jgi:hypothetical protein